MTFNRILIACLVTLLVAAGGALALVPCPDAEALGPGVECDTISVFEDRNAGAGREIDVHFMVLRATGDDPEPVPVVLLAGGPGQGSTQLTGLALGPFAPIREKRDILMMDQRGTGRSNPLDCSPEGAEEDPQVVFGNLFFPELVESCRERLEKVADLGLYTTSLAADDLDEIRQLLGYEQLMLWGGSYGTRLSMEYMRRHPERVVAAALDGLAAFDLKAPLYYARDSQRALDGVFEGCGRVAACSAAFPDLEGSFDRLLGRFADGPIEIELELDEEGRKATVRMSRGDFGYAVRGLLYSTQRITELPGVIHRAAESGDLSAFADAYYRRAVGLGPAVEEGLHFSVFCAEDIAFIPDREVAAATRGTFLGDYLVSQYRGACEGWRQGEVEPGYHLPITSDTPVLIFSGGLDPTVPPEWATAAARHLSNHLHVIVPYAGHGANFDACDGALVLQFLETASLEGLDASCVEQRDPAFVVDATPNG